MGRWEPNSRGRLERAALELYVERGFDQTTVAEIAERAGLTERTFFRHFADKREVLFGGAHRLEQAMVEAVAAAPAEAAPLEAVAAGLDAAAELLGERGEHAVRRNAVIQSNPELKERELIKMASLSAAMTATLRERGVAEPSASLAAQAGVAVFHVAFQRWIDGSGGQELKLLMRESLDELRAVTAER